MIKQDDILEIKFRIKEVQESLLNLTCSLEEIGFRESDLEIINLSNTIDSHFDSINEVMKLSLFKRKV